MSSFLNYSAPPFVVGILHSQTGATAASEVPMVDAAKLAIAEINQSGGVLGRPIHPIVANGASSPIVFSSKMKELIFKHEIKTFFGGWSSDVRKALVPTLEKYNALLWYPLHYEGLEASRNIFYTGACPNQQVEPALDWLFHHQGKRLLLLGSDETFSRIINKLLRAQITLQGGEIVDECYIPHDASDFTAILDTVQSQRPNVIFSTLDNRQGLNFYRAYHRAGLEPEQTPILSASLGEEQLVYLGDAAVGHYLTWHYFRSLDTPENLAFIQRFQQRYGPERSISAPMISAYSQIYLWKQAVETAGSFDIDQVRVAAYGQTFQSPAGSITLQPNHHTTQHCCIGAVQSDGSVQIIERSPTPIPPTPWLGVETADIPNQPVVLQLLEDLGQSIQTNALLEKKTTELEEFMTMFEEQILERKRAEQELLLMLSMSQAMSQAMDLDGALAIALEKISNFTGWPYGEIWFPNVSKTHLNTSDVWHLAESRVSPTQAEELRRFRVYTESMEFRIDEGFLGSVYGTAETQWSSKFGLYGAVGVPILSPSSAADPLEDDLDPEAMLKRAIDSTISGRKVLAIMVFLLPDKSEEDQRLIELISATATQLGTFVQQKKADAALRHKNKQLGKTLRQLKQAQGELVQSEKMAALGQLVAGVAHEINTPLGAICSSTEYISDFLAHDLEKLPSFFQELSLQQQDLFTALFHHARHTHIPLSNRERRQARRTLIQQMEGEPFEASHRLAELIIDLNLQHKPKVFLHILRSPNGEEFLETLSSVVELCHSSRDIITAAGRASKVIFALKTYTNYEKNGTLSTIDIRDNIEGVLALYSNKFKNGIRLVRSYSEQVSLILGHAEDLSQVWMNLIHNALQAMSEKGTLLIEIRNLTHALEVNITDSGCGIPESILPKIFNPFFTTKPAGEGSGLGLDISQKIIRYHQGSIAVESAPGKTTFTVLLPRQPGENSVSSAISNHCPAPETQDSSKDPTDSQRRLQTYVSQLEALEAHLKTQTDSSSKPPRQPPPPPPPPPPQPSALADSSP